MPNCGESIPAKEFNLRKKQEGFIIAFIVIDCPNGHPNVVEPKESRIRPSPLDIIPSFD